MVLNCINFATPTDLYNAILSGLLGKHSGRKSAFSQLSHYFMNADSLTVLVLDEMDTLLTRKSTEFYNVTEWCSEGGKLCIIGIANTISFPQKLSQAVQRYET